MTTLDRCKVFVSDIAPAIAIDSITINYADNERQNLVISTRMSLEERVKEGNAQRWYDNEENLKYLKVRLVTCMTPEQQGLPAGTFNVSSCLDFWAQRINEYSLLDAYKVKDNQNAAYTPGSYLQHIMEELSFNNDRIVFDNDRPPSGIQNLIKNPYYPYNRNFNPSGMQDNPYSQFYDGMLREVVVSQRNLVDLLPREREDSPDARITSRIVEKTSIGPTADMVAYELVDLPSFDLCVGPAYTLRLEDFQHLSMYAFVYFDYSSYIEDLDGFDLPEDSQDRDMRSVLEEGVGVIATATLLGNKTIFSPLLGETPPARETGVTYVENGEIVEEQVQIYQASVNNWGMR